MMGASAAFAIPSPIGYQTNFMVKGGYRRFADFLIVGLRVLTLVVGFAICGLVLTLPAETLLPRSSNSSLWYELQTCSGDGRVGGLLALVNEHAFRLRTFNLLLVTHLGVTHLLDETESSTLQLLRV